MNVKEFSKLDSCFQQLERQQYCSQYKSLFLEYNEPVYKENVSSCGSWGWFNPSLGEYSRFYCKGRNCINSYCRHCYKQKRISLFSQLVLKYDLRVFFTITLMGDRRGYDTKTNADYLKECWANFLRVMKRKLKKDSKCYKFVWCVELHKDGTPHLHGFDNNYIDVKLWRKHLVANGLGEQTDRQFIEDDKYNDTERLVNYVAACVYANKDTKDNVTAMRLVKRTWGRSNGIKSDTEIEKKIKDQQKEFHINSNFLDEYETRVVKKDFLPAWRLEKRKLYSSSFINMEDVHVNSNFLTNSEYIDFRKDMRRFYDNNIAKNNLQSVGTEDSLYYFLNRKVVRRSFGSSCSYNDYYVKGIEKTRRIINSEKYKRLRYFYGLSSGNECDFFID